MSNALDAIAANATRIYTETDKQVIPALARHGKPVACKPGCYHCCKQLVVCSFPEAAFIAHGLASAPDFYDWIPKLVSRAEEAQQILPEDYYAKNLPCAFVVNGMCAVYSKRPGVCRDYYVFGTEPCTAENGGHPPSPGRLTNAAVAMAYYAKEVASAVNPKEHPGLLPPFASLHLMVLTALIWGTSGKRANRVIAACSNLQPPDVWHTWYCANNKEASLDVGKL